MVLPKSRVPPRLECLESYSRLARDGFSGKGLVAEAVEALRQHNALILNAAGEGIYGVDLDGCATFINPAAAAMTGHSVRELLGQPMHDVLHHSHSDCSSYPRHACPIYAAFRDGLVRNVGDEVFWRKDGTSFPVEYTSTPIFSQGKLVGAVVVFRDITLRRQTEERLRQALREVQALKERLQAENRSLRRSVQSTRTLDHIVGNSPALQLALDMVARVAGTDSTVLVHGETGTGKELVARAIHQMSPRRERPLVKVNCGAIPTNLIESELFGHERGAFTGAEKRRAGRFELAHGGTIFLDEIGELPLDAQVKLLRVLQEREIEPLGGERAVRVDVRVVTATNRDLQELVDAGCFRMDLFYRLNVVPVRVPPLRERRSDIPALVEHFLSELEDRWQRPLGRVDEAGLARLCRHDFPGNVRELQAVLERAALESDSRIVRIPEFASAPRKTRAFDCTKPTERLEDVERRHILHALERTRWRISGDEGAALLLGLHPNTLRYRMKKLGLSRT
ncbi:MAG TPA: sigma 54-interacting transcriptional regulator [Polyangiaceae bacterium]